HHGPDYVYDVVVRDTSGRPVVSWAGLQLRDIGPIDIPGGLPHLLLSPYLQRGVTALLPDTGLSLDVLPGGPRTHARASRLRPKASSHREIAQSRSHIDGLILETSASRPVACDWEPVV